MLKKTLITLSRQYGSGGREVCEFLSKKLGIPYFDREILTEAATKAGVLEADYKTLNEMSYKLNRITFSMDAGVPRDTSRLSNSHQMFLQQSSIIKKLASQGSGIFLGRCADYILGDNPQCYSFYTYADDSFRENRAQEKYEGMSLKQLNKIEKKRGDYYRLYTGGREIGNKTNYHMMLNTGKINPEQAAELIIELIDNMQK